MNPPVWFVAHPVAGDERFTFKQNMAHIEKVVGICFRAGVRVVAPYVMTCRILDDSVAAERALGMEANDAVIRGLGRLLMVGHKRSAGMQHEVEVVTSLEFHAIRDFVGVPDAWLAASMECR